MTRTTIPVSVEQSMAEAAAVLCKSQVSGAPIVDSDNRCVGVLSAFDFVRRELAGQASATGADAVPQPNQAETETAGVLGTDTVATYMSAPVCSIRHTMSVLAAARLMCDRHIHRIIVLDDDEHPVGIVTALDLVAALIHVAEEGG